MPRPCIVRLILLASVLRCSAEAEAEAQTDPATCKAHEDLCITGEEEGRKVTIEEDIASMCPSTKASGGKIMATILWCATAGTRLVDKLSASMGGRQLFSPGWADDYTMSIYENVGQLMMRMYYARDKTYVKIPDKISSDETVKMGNNFVPHHDVDGTPNFLWMERYVPEFIKPWLIEPIYTPFLTCFYGGMRVLPFEDALDKPDENTWELALKGGQYASRKDWLMSFYNNLKTLSGDPSWPNQRMDFTGLFRNGDHWDDGLESAIAFDAIGVHRVQSSIENPDGLKAIGVSEALPFVIKLNDFSDFSVRPHFGKFGVDLYFTAEGLPAALQTTDGKWITRGDKEWQYWKFVWRSSLVTVITLTDHLYLTHFKASNTLARSIRTSLPPTHTLRRFLSIFTFGAIFVNLQAQFVLVGKDAMLHRATPFQDFEGLSDIVPTMLADVAFAPGIPGRGMEALIDDEVFEKLPEKLKVAPFYADGKLVFNAIYKLSRAFTAHAGTCEGLIHDEHLQRFVGMLRKQMAESHYQTNMTFSFESKNTEQICRIMEKRLAVYIFMVTAWHSHVGFVGDYYADPDLAVMSWKEGERTGRPRQAMITSVINIFTSTVQPKLTEDYTHLFKDGVDAGTASKLTSMWHEFVADLGEVKREIDKRNTKRKIPNINMDPAILECSVAK